MNLFVKSWTVGMDERQEAVVYKALANAFFILLVCMWLGVLIRPGGHSLFADNMTMALAITTVPAIYLQVTLIVQDAYIRRREKDSKVTLGALSLAWGLFILEETFDDMGMAGFGIWRHGQFQSGFSGLLISILSLTVGGTLLLKGLQERRDAKR